MLSEKAPAEELDENNQKRLQKIVGNFLYYDRATDPTMLMTLNSLSAVLFLIASDFFSYMGCVQGMVSPAVFFLMLERK